MRASRPLWFFLHAVLWLLAFDLVLSAAEDDVSTIANRGRLLIITVGTLMASFPVEFGYERGNDLQGLVRSLFTPPSEHRRRERKFVHEIMDELGPYYVKRAHRMKSEWFWDLHRLIKPHLKKPPSSTGRTKKHKNGAKNGLITSPTRLSAAIRCFAGGRPEDIAVVHGMSHTEVFKSVWAIVDAVNKCPELAFKFPESYEDQAKLAEGFKARSQAGFDTCVGAVDGMLLWIEKPIERDCRESGCGSKKFFCGRKHRFGLNLQGTCDSECRFLDVDLHHPASTSDFLTFSTSSLFHKLEGNGFLKKGFCLFGDSAYVGNRYFATPYKNVSGGTKDAYNFYHSQLRIRIECAFGQLVHRWGILRRAIPASVGLKKTVALVLCLCRLHNYCINKRLEDRKTAKDLTLGMPQPLASDALGIACSGGISLTVEGENAVPAALLHGSEHHDDTAEGHRRQFARRGLGSDRLPREILHDKIVAGGFQRPRPKTW